MSFLIFLNFFLIRNLFHMFYPIKNDSAKYEEELNTLRIAERSEWQRASRSTRGDHKYGAGAARIYDRSEYIFLSECIGRVSENNQGVR